MPPINSRSTGPLLATLAAASFSLKAIFVKLAYASYPVDAITLLALRMAIALPGFLALVYFSRAVGRNHLTGRDWRWLLALGLSGYYLSSLFDFLGLQTISAGLERMILFTYPTLVLLIEAALQRRRIPPLVFAAMLLTYLGLMIAFGHDLQHQGDSYAVWVGGGWVFLSGLSYAAYSVGSGAVVGHFGATRLAGYTGALACVFVLVHFALARDVAAIGVLPAQVWLWAGAMAVFSTVLPIWLAAKAMAQIGASHTAAIGTLGPIITVGLGWLVLNEPFSWAQVLGMGLVIGGVVWLGRVKRTLAAAP